MTDAMYLYVITLRDGKPQKKKIRRTQNNLLYFASGMKLQLDKIFILYDFFRATKSAYEFK